MLVGWLAKKGERRKQLYKNKRVGMGTKRKKRKGLLSAFIFASPKTESVHFLFSISGGYTQIYCVLVKVEFRIKHMHDKTCS